MKFSLASFLFILLLGIFFPYVQSKAHSSNQKKTPIPTRSSAPYIIGLNTKDLLVEEMRDSSIDLEANKKVPTRAPTLAPIPPVPPTNSYPAPPPCITGESDIAYINGEVSTTQTFYTCLQNIPDPFNIPVFYNGSYNGWMWVNTSIQLNNLHAIDAVAGMATVDFYLRLWWVDKRINMPVFWNKLSAQAQQVGFEITSILAINTSIGYWTPDIRFHDAASVDYIAQPRFKFQSYPADRQTVNIRYGSYAYNSNIFRMNFTDPALSFNTNYDGSFTFTENPVWTFDNTTEYTNYDTYISSSGFMNPIYHIAVTRQGAGIVVRLILPITLLVILAGLTFWAEPANRVDSTTTLLLAISALYIVILANIPLLGYLTAIDRYVFIMFLMLVLAVILHQSYSTLNDKTEIWPLRIFYIRLLEATGRVGIFPVAIFFFLAGIQGLDNQTVITMFAMVTGGTGLIFSRELFGVMNAWKQSKQGLIDKLTAPDLKVYELSKIEILVLNFVLFSRLTLRIDYISEGLRQGTIEPGEKKGVSVKHVTALEELLTGTNRVRSGTRWSNASLTKSMDKFDEADKGRGQFELSMVEFPLGSGVSKYGQQQQLGSRNDVEKAVVNPMSSPSSHTVRRSVSEYPDSDDEEEH